MPLQPTMIEGKNEFRCLVVDDSLFARKNMTKAVEATGGVVIAEASNGREAVEKYFEHKPDLVLMDISMPEMEGIEALGLIRKGDTEAKVVMVSALGHQDVVKKGISMGAKHFIAKPIQLEKVASIIRFVLDREGER